MDKIGLQNDKPIYTFDRAIQEIWLNTLDLCKECLETDCVDLGPTQNEFEYKNYMIENPLTFGGGMSMESTGGSIGNGADFSIYANIDWSGFEKYNAGNYNIRRGVESRQKTLQNLDSRLPADFAQTSISVGKSLGMPPIGIIYMALSESNFKDCPNNSLGYGGYLGQKDAVGKPLEEQIRQGSIYSNWKKITGQGASGFHAIGLLYVAHHLPVIGNYIWADTGGKPWTVNADQLASLLDNTYNKRMSSPMSAVRRAEAMTVNVYAGWSMYYISTHQDQYSKYF